MDRISSQRIRNVEKLLSKAEEALSLSLKEREEFLAVCNQVMLPEARLHATAVAAIVISGEPKVDEPFLRAWVRTLRHYGIAIKNKYGRQYEYKRGHEHEYKFNSDYERELKEANRKLYPAIMQGGNETKKFSAIFKTAPVWLLEFTQMSCDAYLLKFDLRNYKMSDKQVWGEEGLKDLLRWPLLPLGRMTDGDPVPERSRKRRIRELMDQKIKSISSTDL